MVVGWSSVTEAISRTDVAVEQHVLQALENGDSFMETRSEIKPLSVRPLTFGESAPRFTEVHRGSGGVPCKKGFGCVYENGVCCEGGAVCCEFRCLNTNPPTCGPTPSQIALSLAMKKMQEEGEKEIKHEDYQKKKTSAGKKLLQEMNKKKANEAQMKSVELAKEDKEKKAESQKEQSVKNEITQLEEKGKQRLQKEKAAADKKKLADLEASKSIVIKPDNYEPKKNTIVASAGRIANEGKFTYAFWIYPSGTEGSMANIFHKGATDGERNPAVYFYPNQLRLHVRSGNTINANFGVDTPHALPLHKWSHVAILHGDNQLRIYVNGKVAATANHAGSPLANGGPLYAGSPFADAALCALSDFRYMPRLASEKEILELYKGKRYQEIKSSEITLLVKNIRPVKGHVHVQNTAFAGKEKSTAQTWMFYIKPEGVVHRYANVFQKGTTNEQRNIGVWFHPGSLRLHIRSGTARGWNDGLDPEAHLKVWKWTHVAITHKAGEFLVYYDGVKVASASLPAPMNNDGPLYISAPTTQDAAPCELADLRYVDSVLDVVAVRTAMEQKKYKKNPPKEVMVVPSPIRPSQGNTPPDVKISPHLTAYSYVFWLKPEGTTDSWSNIFHKGEADSQRNAAVWFYPGTFKLHIRSGTRSSYNDGLDPASALPANVWTHVAVVHAHSFMEVFYNGLSQGREWKWQPNANAGTLKVSNPWYPAAKCMISDLRVFEGPISKKKIDEIISEGKNK